MNCKMMKSIKTALVLCLVAMAAGVSSQSDSTRWQSIELLSTTDYLTSNDKIFRTHHLGFTLGYEKSVFVGELISKKLSGIHGVQGGLNFYRKFDWGYSQIGYYHSNSKIFPSSVLESNIYVNSFKSTEINLGYRRMSFLDGSKVNMISLGMFYYLGDWMMSYHYSHVVGLTDGHRLMLRKYLGGPKDYLQCTAFLGNGDVRTVQLVNQSRPEVLVQFLLNKKIFEKLEVKGSVSVKGYRNEGHLRIKYPVSLGITVGL